MPTEEKLTGYPSIDKPWLKYYSEDATNAPLPECTMYEFLWEENKNKLSDIAIEYFGTKITYRQLFERIDMAAKAFVNIGIGSGDVVPIMAVNMPEVIYSIYGLNRIGAVPNMIDPRSKAKGLTAYINETQSRCLVVLDICCSAVNDIGKCPYLENIVVLSVADSMNFPLKQIMRLKNRNSKIASHVNTLKWNNFISCANNTNVEYVPYRKNQPAIIVHTGGTTGTPKGVVLSNDNVNASAHQVKYTHFDIHRQDCFLNILVPFVAYGIVLGMHAPLSLGWKSVLIPKFEPNDIVKLMLKYEPAVVMGIATYFEPLLKQKGFDFSKCKAILMGGMPTKETFEADINKHIAEGGGKFIISKGYSMTEASSCATCSYDDVNKAGSNGIPLVNTVIAAFDTETGSEMKYGELGEICILTPTRMLEYYDRPEETTSVLHCHEDGNVWIHSGDIGYVTEDGFVFVVDRIKRMIIRRGFKVFPSEIENVILKHSDVTSCAVIGIDDKNDDKAPFAYVVCKSTDSIDEETQQKLITQLISIIENSDLPPYFMPVGFKVMNEPLPLTPAGKVDYRALEKEAAGIQ